MADKQPNIAVFFWDNFGWGELGCYGGGVLRGAPTPRIDKLAGQGLQLPTPAAPTPASATTPTAAASASQSVDPSGWQWAVIAAALPVLAAGAVLFLRQRRART